MEKNVAGQKWVVFAFDRTDNTPKTGDAANITANLRIDGGAANAVDDTNPTELEDGYYVFDITQAESNGNQILIAPASGTADIQVIGVPGVYDTTAPNFNVMGIESDGDFTKVNTLDGHTPQTADHTAGIADIPTVAEFNARSLPSADYTIVSDLGTVQTADHTAGIADIPTVAEFNARTLSSADYVVVGDTIAGVTLVDTCTTNTDMRGTDGANTTVPDAAGTAPTAAENADAVWDEAIAGHVGAGSFGAKNQKVVPSETIGDYKADVSTLATEAKQDTAQTDLDTITGADGVTLATAQGNYAPAVAGDDMNLASTGLDSVVMSDLAAVPGATASIKAAVNWIFELCRNKVVTNKTNSEIEVYKDNTSTKFAEADISDDGTLFTRGEFGAVD